MSLTTPTTKEVSDNILAQLQSAFNQTIPLLAKAFLRLLPKVLAGVFILLYKYGGRSALDQFVQTAAAEDTIILGVVVNPLKFWGRLIGVGDPVAATRAELSINITVENQTGSLPSGSQLINSGNGVTYLTIGAVLLNSVTVPAIVRASADQTDTGGEGAIGNLDPGANLTFANPLPNVAREAIVTAQTVTGANGESTEAYRQRIIDRFQKRPQGGALADYEEWGEEVAGILNVYPYTSDCPGQVDVFVEATVESSGNPDGIPTAAQLQAVLDSIELDEDGIPTRRPANALANTFPITRVPFDVRVLGISVPGSLGQVQTDITTAVEEYFLGREPFIVGLTAAPRRDQVTQTGVGGVVEDIVSAAGGVFTSLVLTQNTIPVIIFSLGIGEKSKASSVAFV